MEEKEIEEEVFEIDNCRIYIDKKGDVKIKCRQKIDKIKIDDLELRMIQGISDLVKTHRKKK